MKLLHSVVRPFLGPADSEGDLLRKYLLVPIAFAVVTACSLILLSAAFVGAVVGAAFISVLVAVSLFFLITVYTTKKLSDTIAGVYTISVGGAVVTCDIWTYGLVEYYTSGVIMMDVLLLCDVSPAFTRAALLLIFLVVCVQTFEQTEGMGLYDSIPEEWSGYTRPDKQGRDYLVNLLFIRLLVLSLDFLMTRYFSYGMRAEKARMERSIVMAQEIAGSLARFDLDEGEEKVRDAVDLPDELMEAFTTLLNNLRTYKPYLPQSCLPNEYRSSGSETSLNAPSPKPERGDRLSRSASCGITLEAALQRKSVTLAVANIRGFLSHAESLGLAGMTMLHEEYIAQVHTLVKASRGLVEGFSCDRVLISFNGAKPCASHQLQCLDCVNQLVAVPTVLNTTVTVTIAFSTGDVTCGPLGIESMKAYSIVGGLGAWVPVLERVASQLKIGSITDSTMAAHAEVAKLRLIGRVCFAKTEQPHEREIFEFIALRQAADEEWMYQLATVDDAWSVYNTVVRNAAEGKVVEARAALRELSDKTDEIPASCFQSLVQFLESKVPKTRTPPAVISDVGIQGGVLW